MGLETALAIGAGSQLLGSGLQYFENTAARKRASSVASQAQSITGAPLPGQTNSGQDSFLQYLRSNPTALQPFQFNTSQAFKDLQANDTANLNDQLATLSAGAGSLSDRFGTGFASKQALLQSRFAGDIAARNAGIAQSSFNTALSTGLQSFLSAQQNQTNAALAQRAQQLQALGINVPSTGAGQLVSQTGGDIAQLLTLLNYFKGQSGGTGSVPSYSGSYAPGYNPGYSEYYAGGGT